MKITKFVHSCVLVQTDERTVLFDPGSFSWRSGLIKIENLPEIHDIIVTHEHPDHFDEEFVGALIARYPKVQWVTNSTIADKLTQLGAVMVSSKSTEFCEVLDIPHADVAPFGVPVAHIAANWNGLVTHPGDTLDFDKTQEILHLPITAPWGKTVDAMKKVIELRPRYVLPVHDWMLRDEWLKVVYDRTEALCGENGAIFLRPVDGQTIEIEV